MKLVNIIVDILKVIFSGFATNIFKKESKEIIISKNQNVEISENEINNRSIVIKKNKNTKVSRNKWE